ncbi:iron-sulfur cluster assembly protein [Chloroflexota bacterium]
MDKKDVIVVLNQVYDPDYIDRSVVDMGLLTEDDITITDKGINITYTLTATMCPFSAALGLMMKYALEKKLKIPVTVRLKADHYQGEVVNELLQDAEKSNELMNKIKEFGIFKRCVRLKEES